MVEGYCGGKMAGCKALDTNNILNRATSLLSTTMTTVQKIKVCQKNIHFTPKFLQNLQEIEDEMVFENFIEHR